MKEYFDDKSIQAMLYLTLLCLKAKTFKSSIYILVKTQKQQQLPGSNYKKVHIF